MSKSQDPKELLRKAAISGTTLPLVILNRQQTDAFLDDVVDETNLLKSIRNVRKDHPSGELNRLYFSAPVTEDATLTPSTKTPSEASVNYDSSKLRCAFDLKTDFVEDIKALSPEDGRKKIAKLFATQVGNDLEQLAFEGDSSISGTTSAADRLEGANDGFIKIIDDDIPATQDLDAGGAAASKKLLFEMLQKLPSKYKRNKNDLRWITGPSTTEKWMYDASSRATELGDKSLEGRVGRPFGIRFLECGLMPEDLVYHTATTDCTQIILADPRNLLYIVQRKVTWEWDRAPRKDQWEITIHMRVDYVIEIIGAIVRAKNISLTGTDYS